MKDLCNGLNITHDKYLISKNNNFIEADLLRKLMVKALLIRTRLGIN